MNLAEIQRRVNNSQSEMQKNRTKFSETVKVIDPNRAQFFKEDWNYETHFRDVYDDTAILAARTFVNTMQQSIVPSQQEWAELDFGKNVPKQVKETEINLNGSQVTFEQALSETTKIVFEYIMSSNFDEVVNEALRDVVISTGTISCDYDIPTDSLNFKAHALCDILLEPSPYSKNKSVFCCYKVPIHSITELWPTADTTIYDKQIQTDLTKLISGIIYDYEKRKYFNFLISEDNNSLLMLDEYGSFSPFVIFRTDVSPTETYGRGIGQMVAPTAKTLQEVKRDLLIASQINMFGMYMSNDDSVLGNNQIEFSPGTIIPVKSTASGNPSIMPLEVNGNINLTQLNIQDMQNCINKAFMVNPIGDMNDPTKTATEIIARQQMAMAERIPEAMRLANELGKGIFQLAINILQYAKKIPMFNVDGKVIKVNLKSPIATLSNQQTAQQALRVITELQQSGVPMPLINGCIKTEELPDYIWDNFDCDPLLKRTDQEKQQLQAKMQNQIQAQAQAQAQQQQGGQPQGAPQQTQEPQQ